VTIFHVTEISLTVRFNLGIISKTTKLDLWGFVGEIRRKLK